MLSLPAAVTVPMGSTRPRASVWEGVGPSPLLGGAEEERGGEEAEEEEEEYSDEGFDDDDDDEEEEEEGYDDEFEAEEEEEEEGGEFEAEAEGAAALAASRRAGRAAPDITRRKNRRAVHSLQTLGTRQHRGDREKQFQAPQTKQDPNSNQPTVQAMLKRKLTETTNTAPSPRLYTYRQSGLSGHGRRPRPRRHRPVRKSTSAPGRPGSKILAASTPREDV